MPEKTTFISLLRAVNVGGQGMVRMPELKALYQSLGFQRVETYLQSGNVVFDADAAGAEELEGVLEARILQEWGHTTPVLVRTVPEWRSLVEACPFSPQQLEGPARTGVMFLRRLPDAGLAASLQAPEGSTDWFQLAGREVYLYFPDGFGRSKLNNAFFEKKLRAVATMRNWNSVENLFEIALRG